MINSRIVQGVLEPQQAISPAVYKFFLELYLSCGSLFRYCQEYIPKSNDTIVGSILHLKAETHYARRRHSMVFNSNENVNVIE